MAADITLPDQAQIDKGATLQWADGAFDGVLSITSAERMRPARAAAFRHDRAGGGKLALDRLRGGTAAQFWQACEVGDKIGIDAWTYRFERQQAGQSDEWYQLMRTNDPARIDHVLDLARQQIDLRAVARGPAEEMGFGPSFSRHGHLDFILGWLGRFPGKGWDMLAAGLQSPVTRNRNLALRVLNEWRAEHWPDQAPSLLTSALAREPADGVRKRIQAVLDGRPLG
jgi:hypothetical protein